MSETPVFLLCCQCHDEFGVLKVFHSEVRARVMADIGNRIEVGSVTRHLIALARAADSDDERDVWAQEMMRVRPDGARWWRFYVQEAELS